jgi:hypothetical protein
MRKLLTFFFALAGDPVKRFSLIAAFVALALVGAQAQGPILPGPGLTVASGGGTNNLAFDASSPVGSTGSTSTSVTLTTTQPNDIIIVCIQANAQNPIASNLTDTAGLTYTQIGSRAGTMSVFFAIAPSILTSDVITITYGDVSGFDSVQAAAFSGANTSTPFDSNGALPGTTTTSGTPLTLTTSNALDLLFACYSLNGGTSAGTGWTGVPGSGSTGFDAFEYQIVNSTQSGTPANLSNNSQIKNGFGHALVSR